ncbi:MAG: hypothetical protein CL997_02745 [Euryarchaeota archaeon]|nr:hypothetical protein [Euryarchaeota archaeon]
MLGSGHFQEFEDEYMEMMYQFHEKTPSVRIRNRDLADAMGVKPASATEMVQRLASKGFLDYKPYKGARLTDSGLIYGKRMKRRHRLAEVFLSSIPFRGDIHQTACRLEHAINDDLEASLTVILGDPDLDPSGQVIPEADQKIRDLIDEYQTFHPLGELALGESAQIECIFLEDKVKSSLESAGLKIEAIIRRENSGFFINQTKVEMTKRISDSIIVRKV